MRASRRGVTASLLWADSQQWFGPQGWSPTPPGQLAQFAVDEPDHGPEWVADQLFYQIFPIGSPAAAANTASRAAATAITRPVPGDSARLAASAGGSPRRLDLYGGDLDISAKLPYLQQLGVTALYLNPILPRRACISTIPRTITRSIRTLAATRRCSVCE